MVTETLEEYLVEVNKRQVNLEEQRQERDYWEQFWKLLKQGRQGAYDKVLSVLERMRLRDGKAISHGRFLELMVDDFLECAKHPREIICDYGIYGCLENYLLSQGEEKALRYSELLRSFHEGVKGLKEKREIDFTQRKLIADFLAHVTSH